MATTQEVTAKANKYPFIVVVDDNNDFALYYAGSMDKDAMEQSLANLECIMKEPVAVVFDKILKMYRLSTLKSVHSAIVEGRCKLLCHTIYVEDDGNTNPAETSNHGNHGGNASVQTATPVAGANATEAARPHIPRPRNQWILYRQYISQQLREKNPALTAGEISTIVSTMWRNEDPEAKQYFKDLAKEESRQHKRKYPHYKYEARKPGTNKRKYQGGSA